jgi:hypothetical protein
LLLYQFLPILSAPTTFKPLYQQPVSLQQLIELEPDLLTAGASHLQHYRRSGTH